MKTHYPTSIFIHRVSYGETDTMGVLYYAEYLHVFERARSQFIRELGMPYKQVEERGIFLPVRNASCRYRSPARYDDELSVLTTITTLGRASIAFTYEAHNKATGIWLASGATEHAFVNTKGKPTKVPEWFCDLLIK